MSKKFTRRHWGREVHGAYKEATSMLRGASGDYSWLRWGLTAGMVAFLLHFPEAHEWTEWNTKVFLGILLVLVADNLVAKVPLTDMLDALRAASLWVASKGVAAVGSVAGSVVTSVTKKEESVTTTSVGSGVEMVGAAVQTEVEP